MPGSPAIFFDRDGTLIEHVHYLVNPAHVRVVDGAAEAIIRLRSMGFRCIVVTNQSVIEKKMLSELGLQTVHAEMQRQLAEQRATLDGIYHCPRASLGKDPTKIEFEDRKPGPGMLQRAAIELELDLSRSWMIGDSISDVLAGHHAGCRGSIWLRGDACDYAESLRDVRWSAAADLDAAVQQIIDLEKVALT